MNTTTKILQTIGFAVAIVAGSLMAVTLTNAHGLFGGSEEERSTAVSELAERFNLDEGEVQAYFDEKRNEYQAKMEAKHAERLASLVEDGTITQAQADNLQAKHEEMRAAINELKDSDADRDAIHEQMETLRADLEAWAAEQGIDLDAIRPVHGHGRGYHGPRAGFNDAAIDSSAEG